MAAFIAQEVTIEKGYKDVVVDSGESTEGIQYGDFLVIGIFPPCQINRTYLNSNNKPVIELIVSWNNPNQDAQPAIVIPTTINFKDTVTALQNANRLVNDNTKTMQDWQTKIGEVEFVNIDGTTTKVKTLKQMELEFNELLERFEGVLPIDPDPIDPDPIDPDPIDPDPIDPDPIDPDPTGQFTWREQFQWG